MGNHQAVLFRPGPGGSATLKATVVGYPDWFVQVEVVATDAGPAIRDLQVRPVDASATPAGGLPARLIRKVNPGELLDLATEAAIEKKGLAEQLLKLGIPLDQGDPVADYLRSFSTAGDSLAGEGRRPGRAGNGIDHYLDWAIAYAEKVEAGERHAIVALSDEHGKTRQYVRDTITDARRRHGLLTKPGQGKAGGQLTDKALKLIGERSKTEEEA